MKKGGFTFYCQLIGLGTVPPWSQVLIQGVAPHWFEKVQKHFPWGNPQTVHLQGAYICHQSKQRHIRKTKRRARNWEKERGTRGLDTSPESVQMFRTDSGLGSTVGFHSHQKWINQLQHSSNSSFLLPGLLSQLSCFRVHCASLALLSSSPLALSSHVVPDSFPCLHIYWSNWVACIYLLTYRSATICLVAVYRALDITGK